MIEIAGDSDAGIATPAQHYKRRERDFAKELEDATYDELIEAGGLIQLGRSRLLDRAWELFMARAALTTTKTRKDANDEADHRSDAAGHDPGNRARAPRAHRRHGSPAALD